MLQSGEQVVQAEFGYDSRSYLDIADRRPPKPPWVDPVSERSDPAKNTEMPFEDGSILLDGGRFAAGTLVVIGLVGVIKRNGQVLPSFTAIIEPLHTLDDPELEGAVFVDEFIDPDGVVRLPTTPQEMFDRLVA